MYRVLFRALAGVTSGLIFPFSTRGQNSLLLNWQYREGRGWFFPRKRHVISFSSSVFKLLFCDKYQISSIQNKYELLVLQFAVHTCILQLSAPDLDWTVDPTPFSGLREDVLGTILHFLYAECLPANLTESTARQCISVAAGYPCLSPLSSLCHHYLRNMALKHRKYNNYQH